MKIAFIGCWHRFSHYCKQHGDGIRLGQRSALLHDGNTVHWVARAEDTYGIRFDKCIIVSESIPRIILDTYFSMKPESRDQWEVIS